MIRQGTVLCLLLFTLSVDDVNTFIRLSNFLLYAVNPQIYCEFAITDNTVKTSPTLTFRLFLNRHTGMGLNLMDPNARII